MGKLVGAVALSFLIVVLSVAVLVSVVVGGASSSSGSPSTGPPGSAADRAPDLPAGSADLDRAAAATCPGLPWSLLAAIGTVESDSGRSTAAGVASGTNSAGPRARCSSNRLRSRPTPRSDPA